MTTDKFCRDCMWYVAPYKDKPAICASLNGRQRTDLVTGLARPNYCEVERSADDDNLCGRAGRWFESRFDAEERVTVL